jgi:TetR/AcrR family transcriptional regulator, repressor for neighboring sulfatase
MGSFWDRLPLLTKMSIRKKPVKTRTRRSPEASRDNILAAAEALLLAKGPQALKLTDLAARAGIAHATILHHFGSIADVQTALMERMIRQLVDQLLEAHQRTPVEGRHPEVGLQAMFDTFEGKGAARLAAWLELTGEVKRLTMVRDAVRSVVASRAALDGLPRSVAENHALVGIVLAMGTGLFGRSLAELMDRPAGTTRQLALEFLGTAFGKKA